MSTQTPIPVQENLIQHFEPEELNYVVGLYEEGLDQATPELQEQHIQEVAELVGDLAVHEVLLKKVNSDRQIAEANARNLRDKRAGEAAIEIETQGYYKAAPNFKDQVSDPARTSKFMTNRLPSNVDPEGWETEKHTEAEGLTELNEFLHSYIDRNVAYPDKPAVKHAKRMAEDLTFIGWKEYTEATHGIAKMWKNYLDEDPANMLCVLTEVSESEKYPGKRKSDDHLRDSILRTFSDEELEKYSGRLVNDLEDIQDNSVEKTRIVLVDDWVISGQQARRVYEKLKYDPYFEPFAEQLEVNVIVASEDRINHGLKEDSNDPSSAAIKLKSYFKSHHVENSKTENKGYVTGLHSTVNYDFEDIIRDIVYEDAPEGSNPRMPALSSIIKAYRTSKSAIEVKNSGLSRVS